MLRRRVVSPRSSRARSLLHTLHERNEPVALERQRELSQHGALQCGFCTPGMMMTTRWLLDHNPDPSPAQIREALSGQVCRCTGYENIVRAVRWAAEHPAPAGGAEGASQEVPA